MKDIMDIKDPMEQYAACLAVLMSDAETAVGVFYLTKEEPLRSQMAGFLLENLDEEENLTISDSEVLLKAVELRKVLRLNTPLSQTTKKDQL